MWCVTCKADVAAEVSPDSGRVQCATCGSEIAQAHGIRERTKDAREILERWSTKSMMDPYGPLPGSRARALEKRPSAMGNIEENTPPGAAESEAPRPRTRSQQTVSNRDQHMGHEHNAAAESVQPERRPTQTPSQRTLRIDRPAAVRDVAVSVDRVRGQRRAVHRHIDGPHGKELAGPHFEMAPHKQPSWAVTTGQWLAYVGVLALTIGTVVVLYGYLNGYSDYTPTGWLITTLGQMLLFLGVINMVSGGMEQSNDEVSHRIEVIGERLLRIEAATDEVLRGPRIPAERYAEGQVSESQSTRSRETADS